jgi:transposase-like protein
LRSIQRGTHLGLKQFKSATTSMSGIELMHSIRKGQFNLATPARATEDEESTVLTSKPCCLRGDGSP